MTNNNVTHNMSKKNKAIADDLARIAAYTHMLGQLCELASNAEPISLEQLEVIFKDIAQVCDASVDTIHNLTNDD